jgi:hypothetical protein
MKVRDVIAKVDKGFLHYIQTCSFKEDIAFHIDCLWEHTISMVSSTLFVFLHIVLIITIPFWWLPVRFYVYKIYCIQIKRLRKKHNIDHN